MRPLYTREEMRAVDRAASERYGIPSLSLMESAGARATDFIRARYATRMSQVVVVAGEGQNGGDGWVVARHLLSHGVRPRCVLIGDAARVRGDARVNLDALEKLGVAVRALSDSDVDVLVEELRDASLIVDALFGTGLSRPLAGAHARAVQHMNEASAPVCALDLPSGVDADSGQVLGCAVRADATITFAGHKRGLLQFPAVELAGRVRCAGIGAPVPHDGRVGVIEASDVAALLPRLKRDSHKGTRGHVAIVAGSRGKTGAALLSSLGAMRAGSGLVTIVADAETQPVLELKVLEVMTQRFASRADVLSFVQGKGSAVLGPGFGLADERKALARALARELPVPCVIDADGLTALQGELESLREAQGPRILTPHPAEAARLLERSTAEVQADRYDAALELARRSGQVIVLKGAHTVIASPEADVRVCEAGTPALGVAGTGDVLSGVLGALSVGLPAFSAAWAGVQLHAMAGELSAQGDRGLFASEVADSIPRALEQVRSQAGLGVDSGTRA